MLGDAAVTEWLERNTPFPTTLSRLPSTQSYSCCRRKRIRPQKECQAKQVTTKKNRQSSDGAEKKHAKFSIAWRGRIIKKTSAATKLNNGKGVHTRLGNVKSQKEHNDVVIYLAFFGFLKKDERENVPLCAVGNDVNVDAP